MSDCCNRRKHSSSAGRESWECDYVDFGRRHVNEDKLEVSQFKFASLFSCLLELRKILFFFVQS